ncbi:MAG: hypothetical protein D6767_10845 [Candidatus Hydrogenedentota bacterium]|nr:MAG: hypothetical protein D6767_10845 [Candidatus Hydrogenedentota bacterium]
MTRRIVFLLIVTLFSCEKKIPAVDYLSPLDRNQEGFLDKDTFQVLSFARMFSLDAIDLYENKAIFYPLRQNFTQEDLNNAPEFYKAKRQLDDSQTAVYRLKDIFDVTLEIANIAPIAKEGLAKDFTQKMEIRKTWQKQACDQAVSRAMYRWFVLSNPTLKEKPLMANDGVQLLSQDFLPIIPGFPKAMFPPPVYYDKQTKARIYYLKSQLRKKDMNPEIILRESLDFPVPTCKVAILIKKENLLLEALHLAKKL